MSEQHVEQELTAPTMDPDGLAAFTSLMDVLAPDSDAAPAGEGGAPEGGAPAGGGVDGAPAAPAGGEAAAPAAPGAGGAPGAAGDSGAAAPADGAPVAGGAADTGAGAGGAADGQPAVPGGAADASGSGADRPAAWTVDAATVAPKLGELTTQLEEKIAEGFRNKGLEEMRTEYKPYFDAVEIPARVLVGQEVPALGKDGTEKIQSTQDARDYQEAVKALLVDELRDRTTRSMEADSTDLNAVHASVKLFQDNHDLIPGTKGFDRQLADRMATMVKPYEHRVDGKLYGYSIPVQPIIDSIRAQLVTERAATPPAPSAGAGAPVSTPGAPAAPPNPDDQPQAGITSKAGAASETDDMSTLWGTLGLPNLQL